MSKNVIILKVLGCLGLSVMVFSCQTSNSTEESQEVSISSSDSTMAFIPAGSFTMGGKSEQAARDEFPRHAVKLSAFQMDKTEVTNGQFSAFVNATNYVTVSEKDIDWEEMKLQVPIGTPKPPDSVLKAGSLVFRATDGPVSLNDYSQWWKWVTGANWQNPEGKESNLEERETHPVVHIAWEDATAYCTWQNKRLPTEAEWEWAAMGGLEDIKYPWGNESSEQAHDKANFWQGFFPFQNEGKDGFVGTAPVKSYAPNGYGLYDMAGNVWEWCSDLYHIDAYNLNKGNENPIGPKRAYDPLEPNTEKHVIRGGSFLCNDSYCSGYRVARRMSSSTDSGLNHLGFRCVK